MKPSEIPVLVDIEASLGTLARGEHAGPGGMLKLPADLDRYARIIEATKPQVIVETGTRTGASAGWFARQPGVEQVITIDIEPNARNLEDDDDPITWVIGDSADPATARLVGRLVDDRRCMVSLDSDHSAPHVAAEIELYGPMVTPGCYLVVEDGIFAYASRQLAEQHLQHKNIGSPLDAIATHLAGKPRWQRDEDIEQMSATTHHPAGWWQRNEGV